MPRGVLLVLVSLGVDVHPLVLFDDVDESVPTRVVVLDPGTDRNATQRLT